MEMLGDAIGAGEEVDEVLGDVLGLDGADAEAFDGGFVEDAMEEIDEFNAGGEVAAVGAEVDAAERRFRGRGKQQRNVQVSPGLERKGAQAGMPVPLVLRTFGPK